MSAIFLTSQAKELGKQSTFSCSEAMTLLVHSTNLLTTHLRWSKAPLLAIFSVSPLQMLSRL